MDDNSANTGVKPYITLILGAISVISFVSYIVVNNVLEVIPDGMIEVLLVVWILFSLAGVVSAILTKKYGSEHTVAWWIGTVLAAVSFVIAVFFVCAIIILATFLRNS